MQVKFALFLASKEVMFEFAPFLIFKMRKSLELRFKVSKFIKFDKSKTCKSLFSRLMCCIVILSEKSAILI